jgi:aspartate/methionine/tyrosine aminotransferase
VTPFSLRTAWDSSESSYAAAIREARARAASEARPIYDLTLSNPTRCGFAYAAATLLAPLANPRALTYDPDPRGLLSARQAVAAYYAAHHAHIPPAGLTLTTSTSEAYSFLFRLLCNPGDEVLVAQPTYPLFDFLATLDDVTLRPYPLFYDHGWHLDLDSLARAITPRTRAILVVHPNNPTGHFTSPREREHLEALCARHGLALIIDEVFLDYPLRSLTPQNEIQPRSFATGPHPVLTFVLSGISKIVGLPQMKAAWIAAFGPDPLRTEALTRLEIIADTFLSMNAPIQLALPAWLAASAPIQAQILTRARANLATLTRISEASPGRLQLLRTDAGWSAILALPSCVGEPSCAERLIRERGVITHPGAFYAMPEANRIVVSLIVPAADFEAGILAAFAP